MSDLEELAPLNVAELRTRNGLGTVGTYNPDSLHSYEQHLPVDGEIWHSHMTYFIAHVCLDSCCSSAINFMTRCWDASESP